MGRVGRFILKVAAVLILIVSAGTFALSLFTGETRNGENLQSEFDYLITVGISQSGEDSLWKEANTQSFMDTFVEANGYEAVLADAGIDQEKQIKDVEGFIEQEVDYIILNPVTEMGWDDVLQEAKDAHIPVILVNNGIDTEENGLYACTIGSDYSKQMKNAGKWLNEYLEDEAAKKSEEDTSLAKKLFSQIGESQTAEEDSTKLKESTTKKEESKEEGAKKEATSGDEDSNSTSGLTDQEADNSTEEEKKVQIAAIQEFIGSEEQMTRAQGYQTMIDKYSDWEMVAQQTGDESREEAKKIMTHFLEQDPDLRVVFAESDEMAMGAIDAIEEAGKTCGTDGDIILISFGGSKEAIQAVKDGKLNVTFECSPKQGPKAAEVIQRLESDISIDKAQYVEETYFDATMDLDEIIKERAY